MSWPHVVDSVGSRMSVVRCARCNPMFCFSSLFGRLFPVVVCSKISRIVARQLECEDDDAANVILVSPNLGVSCLVTVISDYFLAFYCNFTLNSL